MISSLIVDTESLRNQVIFKMHKQLIDQQSNYMDGLINKKSYMKGL